MHVRRTVTVAAAVMLVAAGVGSAHANPSNTTAAPGPNNAITDVSGLKVGQVDRNTKRWLTGTTVVYAPDMAVTGVDVSGGAPGTHETDLLDPTNSNPGANAVVLSGGSAYGLETTAGVMQWLERRGEGIRVGPGDRDVVPIVPGAILFDLGRSGRFASRPTARWGYRAIARASDGPVKQGTVGAGTGARAGGLKGGIGTASVTLDDGTTVGALVAINAAGSPLGRDCALSGAQLELDDEFGNLQAPDPAECVRQDTKGGGHPSKNTTIAVVATDATLTKAATTRMARVAHDGLARSIRPVHTLSDGDSVFAMATGKDKHRLSVDIGDDREKLNAIHNAGADALSRAVVHAMIEAESTHGIESYCDTYPSACGNRR